MEVTGPRGAAALGPGAARRQPRQQHGPGRGRRRRSQAPPDPRAGEVEPLEGAARSARSSTGWARSRSTAGPATPTRSTARSRRCAPAPASASSPRAPARSGRELRARGGIGRLAEAVPETKIVAASAVTGTTDFARFPTRPRGASASFSRPAGGGYRLGEDHGEFAARLLERDPRRPPPAPRRMSAGSDAATDEGRHDRRSWRAARHDRRTGDERFSLPETRASPAPAARRGRRCRRRPSG